MGKEKNNNSFSFCLKVFQNAACYGNKNSGLCGKGLTHLAKTRLFG